MAAQAVVAVRTQHQARPGRRAIVVTDPGGLAGPARGMVELPLRLFWSSTDRCFDLDTLGPALALSDGAARGNQTFGPH